MKTRKALEEALYAGDKTRVREIVLDELGKRAGHREALEIVTLAISGEEKIYDPDDGSVRVLEKESWSAAYVDELRAALKRNFSLKGLKLYMDVTTELATNPVARRNGEEIDRLTIVEVDEDNEIIDDKPDNTSVAPLGQDTEAKKESAVSNQKTSLSLTQLVGYVMIIAGVIASIVGLCIPLRLLLGIGIVVILGGSALGYVAIASKVKN